MEIAKKEIKRESSNIVGNILEKYCQLEPSEEEEKNGLFLLDIPTGMGKTHHVLDYIFHHYKEKRNIFFVTNLKKNLPETELRERFEKAGKGKDFEKYFLFIDSNSECVIKNLPLVYDDIPGSVKSLPELKSLWKNVRHVHQIHQKQEVGARLDSLTLDMLEKIKEEIRKDLEPKFRKKISSDLNEHFKQQGHKTESSRLRFILGSQDYNWLPQLYPSIQSIQKRIFFLSIDKFFVKNTTFLRPSYYFLSDKITENSLVFIDEFDATKQNILSTIIKNGLTKRVDLIGLLMAVRKQLKQYQFPEFLLQDSLDQKERIELKGFKGMRSILDGFETKVDRIHEKYQLEYFIKTLNAERRRNFIFHDFRYHHILKGGHTGIEFTTNANDKVNWISFTKKAEFRQKRSLILLLQEVKGFFSYFKNGIRILAENYRENKEQEREGKKEEFSLESALNTVLDCFGLDGHQRNFIIDSILHAQFSKLEKGSIEDLSFYENGFRYYDFKDSDDHDAHSIIYLSENENTPEKFVLQLAGKSKVGGLSATATIPTDVGNYCLDFFKSRLQSRFLEVNASEKEELKAHFAKATKGYEQVSIDVNFLNCNDVRNDALWLSIFEVEEIVNEVKLELNSLSCTEHQKLRYLKIAQVFKEFLLKEDIKSLLCFSNAIPKGATDFCSQGLNTVFDALLEVCAERGNICLSGTQAEGKDFYYVINSENFDFKKSEVHKRLEEGKKVFVISSYATMGAGQNLQYAAPSALLGSLVKINDFPNANNLKDFDAIYVEKPTNLLVNKRQRLDEENLNTYLFQLEYLASKGQISFEQLKSEIKKGFGKLAEPHKSTTDFYDWGENSLYKKQDYFDNTCAVLIQAIGRITRSNLKNSTIYIFADNELKDHLIRFSQTELLLIKEFEALRNKAIAESAQKPANDQEELLRNKAGIVTLKSNRYIRKLLSNLREDGNYRGQWKFLRQFVLQNPTLKSLTNPRLSDYYIELPAEGNSYSYQEEHDFDKVQVSFASSTAKVSVEKSGLTRYLELLPQLASYFEVQRYATTFNSARYMLSPSMFKNIYCGAIGEVVGEYIFRQSNIFLEEMEDEHYELFDFRSANGTVIDFKNWNSPLEQDEEEAHQHILSKMKTCGASKAFIVNLYSEGSKGKKVEYDGKQIIEVPSLFRDGKPDIKTLNWIRQEIG